MPNAVQGKEIVIVSENNIGILYHISKVIAERGISLQAVNGTVEGPSGILRLVTDDNLRAMDALREEGYQPDEVEVIMMEIDHKPGMLRNVAMRLSEEELDIHHLYVTTRLPDQKCMVIFNCSNNDHALVVLNR